MSTPEYAVTEKYAANVYEDTTALKRDAPRLPMEMDKLAKHIEMVDQAASRFVERVSPMLRPSEETAMRAMDGGVPTREPSVITARILTAQRQLQSIESSLNDALERLEI